MEDQVPAWVEAMRSFSVPGMLQVLLAAILGGLIGLEREARHRAAGFRTNILIAIGACLFTIISIEGFPLDGSSAQDTARVAAQVVAGIGFLGAGAVFQSKHHTRGLTTAATIWVVAAVGMAVGVKAYFLAVFAALLTLLVLRVLRPISKTISQRDSN